MPASILSSLLVLVFFIPPQSGEKISFGMAVLVAFTVFLILIGVQLPHSSEHTPYICESFVILEYGFCNSWTAGEKQVIHFLSIYNDRTIDVVEANIGDISKWSAPCWHCGKGPLFLALLDCIFCVFCHVWYMGIWVQQYATLCHCGTLTHFI